MPQNVSPVIHTCESLSRGDDSTRIGLPCLSHCPLSWMWRRLDGVLLLQVSLCDWPLFSHVRVYFEWRLLGDLVLSTVLPWPLNFLVVSQANLKVTEITRPNGAGFCCIFWWCWSLHCQCPTHVMPNSRYRHQVLIQTLELQASSTCGISESGDFGLDLTFDDLIVTPWASDLTNDLMERPMTPVTSPAVTLAWPSSPRPASYPWFLVKKSSFNPKGPHTLLNHKII